MSAVYDRCETKPLPRALGRDRRPGDKREHPETDKPEEGNNRQNAPPWTKPARRDIRATGTSKTAKMIATTSQCIKLIAPMVCLPRETFRSTRELVADGRARVITFWRGRQDRKRQPAGGIELDAFSRQK